MEDLMLVLLACITALSFSPTCLAFPGDQQARQPPLAQHIGARDSVNLSFPLPPAPPQDPSITVPDVSPTSTCSKYSPCNLFYQSVSVYYWPPESQNTACLVSMPRPTSMILPSGLIPISPSIYVVFPSIMASDGCNQIGKGYGPLTQTFAPGDLSTIVDRYSTNVFDFADLPCPPSGIEYPSGISTYAPLISPPPFIWQLDPAFANCEPGLSQGVDPPIAFPTDANGLSGPGPAGGGHPHRDLGARAHHGVAPWAPIKTAGPSNNDP